jgi:ABC-type phosphonate transport system ATPase subunit
MVTSNEPHASNETVPVGDPVVSVRGLVTRYGCRDAIRGVDLEVRPGEVGSVVRAL